MARRLVIVPVQDASQVADARRIASRAAESLGFSETVAGKAALAATELATNLVKHGEGGSILVSTDDALTLIAIDKGRGIANVSAALRDGFSTAGSPGTGLGAVARLATTFDVWSMPGHGTAVLCRIDPRVLPSAGEGSPDRAAGRGFVDSAPNDTPPIQVGGVCIAKRGEDVAGDAWLSASTRNFVTIAVIDGLGHGPLAATAAVAALRAFSEYPEADFEQLMHSMHGALRPTRGAAVGLARIHPSLKRIDFAGVGNIAGGAITDDATRRVVSLPGIVGHEMRKVTTFSYPWDASTVLVLHSDGIASSWNLAGYPGLLQRDAALIAAVLYRDYCRGTDDATVVVARSA